MNEVLFTNERQSREIEQDEQILFWLWSVKFNARTNCKFNINWKQFNCFVFRFRWKKYYFVRESFFDFWFFCCCSCCYCCVWCWCWFWFFDSFFRSRFSINFSISRDSESYDRECSSWTRARKKRITNITIRIELFIWERKSRKVIQEIRSRCSYDDVFLFETRAKNDWSKCEDFKRADQVQ